MKIRYSTTSGQTDAVGGIVGAEMKATEGKFIPLGLAVAGGGAFAAWKYHYDVYKATGRIGTSGGAAAISSRTAAIGGGMGAAAGGDCGNRC